jgi:beta-galactosidase
MVYIASYWNEESGTDVRIFSNCTEVELRLNDSLTGRQFPDRDRISGNLPHPPFTFSLGRFVPGTLTATGYISGKVAATHERITPAEPVALRLHVDESGILPEAGTNDVIFVLAELIDLNGTVVPVNDHPIQFELEGAGTLISPSPVVTEAGTAAALIRTGTSPGRITVKASAPGIAGASIEF